MKRITFLFVLAFIANFSYGQKQAQITIINLYEDAGKIYINYDIDQSMPEESFDVKIIATHSNGQAIAAHTLGGDIGENIKGGKNKQVVWSYEQDGIYLDETINIQLFADKVVDVNYYSTPKLLIASTILPGKGVNMLDRSKSYLGWTGLAYGLVGVSVLYSLSSLSTYNNYTAAITATDRDTYYNKYKTKTTVAGVAAISALGVWGWNYVRIFLTKNSIIKNQNSLSSWFLYPSYNTFTNSKMLTLSFKF